MAEPAEFACLTSEAECVLSSGPTAEVFACSTLLARTECVEIICRLKLTNISRGMAVLTSAVSCQTAVGQSAQRE